MSQRNSGFSAKLISGPIRNLGGSNEARAERLQAAYVEAGAQSPPTGETVKGWLGSNGRIKRSSLLELRDVAKHHSAKEDFVWSELLKSIEQTLSEIPVSSSGCASSLIDTGSETTRKTVEASGILPSSGHLSSLAMATERLQGACMSSQDRSELIDQAICLLDGLTDFSGRYESFDIPAIEIQLRKFLKVGSRLCLRFLHRDQSEARRFSRAVRRFSLVHKDLLKVKIGSEDFVTRGTADLVFLLESFDPLALDEFPLQTGGRAPKPYSPSELEQENIWSVLSEYTEAHP